jgi:biopolymer transport protein ExbD/biopolymer transport protein TolR
VSDINVTPMVDVMLVLLIIFMVVTPMLQKGVSVEKVKANNPIAMKDADKEDAILVSITRNGDTYLGTTRMAPDQMPTKIKDMLTNKPEKVVYISADRRAKYERVVTVIDEIRNAGVEQLGMLADEVTPQTGQGN